MTTESKHTPGPWTVRHRHVNRTEFADECAGLGLEIDGPPKAEGRGQFARSADARLIAAAPDLLEALQYSTAFLDLEAECHRFRGNVSKAEACEGQARTNRAAIRKATEGA